jgi:hypothetical protein
MKKFHILNAFAAMALLLSSSWNAGPTLASAKSPAIADAETPDLISETGGAVFAVSFESYAEGLGYLYLGVGRRLFIYHVNLLLMPGTPTLTPHGFTEPLPGVIQDVSIVGNRAFVTMGESGLAIVDIANKDAPLYLNHYDTPGFAKGVFMTATTAYVADGFSGLLALEISDPLNIGLLASYNTEGDARDVIMANDLTLGDLFYVADGQRGLVVLDETASGFVQIGSLDTSGYAESVYVKEKYIHLADGWAGWKKIKIANPASPLLEDYLDTPNWASDALFFGGEVYVADQTSGLRIIGSDAVTGDAVEIASFDTPGLAVGMGWAEGFVLMADYSGLTVIDVNNPGAPTAEPDASIPSLAVPGKLTVVGDRVYTTGAEQGLHIVDAGNPVAPALIGMLDTPGAANDVAVAGDKAFIADGAEGLLQIDVSVPAAPTATYTTSMTGGAFAVVVEGDTAYVAAGANGLAAVQFYNDPNPPQVIGSFDTAGYALDVAVAGEYAYIADGDNGLVIADRFPLDAASLVGSLDFPGTALAVAVQDNTCFIAAGSSGLRIIDISNPAAPIETGYYDTPGSVADVVVVGNLAYLADDVHGLQVINVANPASPFLTASYDSIGFATGVAVTSGNVYLADGPGGLLIFNPVPERYYISLPLLLRN